MAKLSQEVIAAAAKIAGDWTPHMVINDHQRMGDESELDAYSRHFKKCLQLVIADLSDTLK